MTVILMYHALYSNDAELNRIDPEDRPYAVSTADFRQHMALLRHMDTACSPADVGNPDVVVTFDDGHVSNYDIALPVLAESDIRAYFFVTSDFIGKRNHFCNPTQLRALHDAGMIIGSHGKTHGFFADMQKHESDHEFAVSREVLSDIVGEPVKSISFPGGRYLKSQLAQAQQAGYTQIFGSGFGLAPLGRAPLGRAPLGQALNRAQQVNPVALNRIALRATTTLGEFNKIISRDKRYFLQGRARHMSKDMLKRILGNQRYHALYKYAAERR